MENASLCPICGDTAEWCKTWREEEMPGKSCPSASPQEIADMSAIETMTLARDIHRWYASRRKTKRNQDWDYAWVLAYEKCLEELSEGVSNGN